MKYNEFEKVVTRIGFVVSHISIQGRDFIAVYNTGDMRTEAYEGQHAVAVVGKNNRNSIATNDDDEISDNLMDALIKLAKTEVKDRLKSFKLSYENLSGQTLFLFKEGEEFLDTLIPGNSEEFNFTQDDIDRLPEQFKPKNGFTTAVEV